MSLMMIHIYLYTTYVYIYMYVNIYSYLLRPTILHVLQILHYMCAWIFYHNFSLNIGKNLHLKCPAKNPRVFSPLRFGSGPKLKLPSSAAPLLGGPSLGFATRRFRDWRLTMLGGCRVSKTPNQTRMRRNSKVVTLLSKMEKKDTFMHLVDNFVHSGM